MLVYKTLLGVYRFWTNPFLISATASVEPSSLLRVTIMVCGEKVRALTETSMEIGISLDLFKVV